MAVRRIARIPIPRYITVVKSANRYIHRIHNEVPERALKHTANWKEKDIQSLNSVSC